MQKIENLKKPQKEKYRVFAWKTDETPFECYESESWYEIIDILESWLSEERDFNVNVKKQNGKNNA